MIYLVRHGQTEFNRLDRFQGHGDSPLTELGVRQAQAYANLLAEQVRDPAGWRILASPLGRTRGTAEVIAKRLGLPVETEPRLIEVTLGDWDGRVRSELRSQYPDAFSPGGWVTAPGGETYEAMTARISDWFADLPDEPDRRIIAVSHGVTGRVVRGVYASLGREASDAQRAPQDAIFRLKDGSIHRLECEPVS